MDDNIDDLLDEVEAKYLSSTSSRKKQQNDTLNSPSLNKNSIINEFDDLLAEIDDIKDRNEESENEDVCSKSQTSLQKYNSKCFPVYLAGSHYPCGLSSSSNKRSCNKLRCTSCDFKVLNFEDFSWHSSTDYLFLRNNVPDFERLKAKLLLKKGSRAYCCQCFYKTVNSLTPLTPSEAKWVCGQH